jgi:hypothetical protein
MKKRWIVPGLLAGAFVLATAGLANPGQDQGKGKGTGNGKKFGPYTIVTDDHGTCKNVWATDTVKRRFLVKRNRDGSFRLWRYDRGTLVTLAGQSPGACETRSRHGSTVPAGKHGRFHGYLVGTITGGTFNPNAVCTVDCGFTDVFITKFFGPSAIFSCNTNSPDCQFDFQYSAPRQHLRFHAWYDKGHGAGTFLKERFRGDIAGP